MRKIMFLFLLTSCGPDRYEVGDCFIMNNVEICHSDEIPVKDISFVAHQVSVQSKVYHPKVGNAWNDFGKKDGYVNFYHGHLVRDCEEVRDDVYGCQKRLGGVFWTDNEIYVSYNKCIAATSFAHELLHVVEQFYLGGATKEHDTPFLFEEYEFIGDSVKIEDVVEERLRLVSGCKLESCKDYFSTNLCKNFVGYDWYNLE